MSCAPDVTVGPFVVGEIPFTLVYQYLDENGAAIDLSGFTAKFVYRPAGGTATTVNALILDAANGKVSYQWTGAELAAPGQWLGEFWVGNGGVYKLASVLIKWTVRVAVGAVPAL